MCRYCIKPLFVCGCQIITKFNKAHKTQVSIGIMLHFVPQFLLLAKKADSN